MFIDKHSVESQINKILTKYSVTERKNYKKWLMKAVSLIDLTTLSGDNTRSNVTRLCMKVRKNFFTDINY